MMKQFLWGSATASYQCEGAWQEDDKIENMWDHYLHVNHLENGDIASDFYHRYEEDLKMAKEGGQNSFRFSLSWTRIIKNEAGEINPKGIAFYRQLLKTCRQYGLEPNVTIYHWDLPQYLEAKGGWLNEETCHRYLEFAKVCFENFHDLVNIWVTFNEPRWFIFNGYFIGNYPPEHHNTDETIKGAFHVMYASSLAVQAFRKGNYPGNIGIVHSYTPINGVDDTIETRIAMRYADNYCNNWVLDTAALGEIPIDMLGKLAQNHDISYMTVDKLKVIKENTVDFLGLNYYARALVKAYTTGETTLIVNNKGKAGKGTSKTIVKDWFEQVSDPNTKKTEWDTEIYPQGLYEGILTAWEKYRLPIYITENGVGVYEDVSVDQIDDRYRIEFMKEHIDAILKAKKKGADVRGYYAWSTFDLYSWKNGCEKRYGLVAVDFADHLKRKPKASYYWYRDFIKDFQEKE